MRFQLKDLNEAYDAGFKKGKSWTYDYRPGGPFVYRDRYNAEDKDWAKFCENSTQAHVEWHKGFDEGVKATESIEAVD